MLFSFPDLQANAEEKFLRIKHAYNTLMNSESRRRYDNASSTSGSSYSGAGRNQSNLKEEDFYGFGMSSLLGIVKEFYFLNVTFIVYGDGNIHGGFSAILGVLLAYPLLRRIEYI